jgi:hypothetical protein
MMKSLMSTLGVPSYSALCISGQEAYPVSVSDVFDQGEQLAPVEQVLSVKRQFATLNLIFVLII